MQKLLTSTALALSLVVAGAVAAHAQSSGSSGSSGGGTSGSVGPSGSGATGGLGGSSSSGTSGSGQDSSGEQGGTTGILTTTPQAKSQDAPGTRGTEMGNTAQPGVTGGAAAGTTASDQGSWFSTRSRDKIVGQNLYDANGSEIGEIDNVVMAQGGTTPEAVVGVGGFLGIGERDVTIPLSQIQMQGDRLTTSMTKDQIGGLQAYNKGAGWQDWNGSSTNQ
jgi:hypothetical protein